MTAIKFSGKPIDEHTISNDQIWQLAAFAVARRDARLLARCADALRGTRWSRRYKFGVRACVHAYNTQLVLQTASASAGDRGVSG